MSSKNIISFVLITVCILVLPESSPELLNFWIWDMEPANVKSVEKKCIQHRLTNCLGRENTNCINQFRVNLSVNKLIVFCYALKSSKIFWCWSQIIVTIEALMWSFQSEKKNFAFFVRSLVLQHFFLVFVLSMSWQRLRSRTRIVCHYILVTEKICILL